MRRRFVLSSLLALVVLGAGAGLGTITSAPLLAVYNPSPSMPTGWYLRVPLKPTVGRIVVVNPPAGAVAAGWPTDVKLIKPVAAVVGDHVCLRGRTSVLINDMPVAPMHPAPFWQECRTLEPDELFLLAPARLDSLDSRLFGPVPCSSVVGVFTPLWTESP